MISERSLAVLHAIVGEFIDDGEPVGSKKIVEKHSLGVSAATIRNDMALLEEEELIVAPHTSSGRIPTDKGYRLYVDTLSQIRPLNMAQRNAIERFLGESSSLEDMMNRTARLLANLTNQVAVIQYPVAHEVLVRHVEIIKISEDTVLIILITNNAKVDQQVLRLGYDVFADEWVTGLKEAINAEIAGLNIMIAQDRIQKLLSYPTLMNTNYQTATKKLLTKLNEQIQNGKTNRITIAGTANLTKLSDQNIDLSSMLQAIEEQVTLLRLIQELVTDQHGVGALIGRENTQYGLAETSLLASSYETSQQAAGKLGIFGPTRMNYAKNIATMRAISSYIKKFSGEGPLV